MTGKVSLKNCSHSHLILILFYLNVLMVQDREFQFDQWQGGGGQGGVVPPSPKSSRGCQHPPPLLPPLFSPLFKNFMLFKDYMTQPNIKLYVQILDLWQLEACKRTSHTIQIKGKSAKLSNDRAERHDLKSQFCGSFSLSSSLFFSREEKRGK